MSIELIHRIDIKAPAERIYEAITTEAGIRSWWTKDVSMADRVGGKAVFGFEKHSIIFEMQIERLEAPSRVHWRCVAASSPKWIGTTQEFQLCPPEDGEVPLRFCHGGWPDGIEECYYCNTTWGHLLVTLKEYAQSGKQNPYFV